MNDAKQMANQEQKITTVDNRSNRFAREVDIFEDDAGITYRRICRVYPGRNWRCISIAIH